MRAFKLILAVMFCAVSALAGTGGLVSTSTNHDGSLLTALIHENNGTGTNTTVTNLNVQSLGSKMWTFGNDINLGASDGSTGQGTFQGAALALGSDGGVFIDGFNFLVIQANTEGVKISDVAGSIFEVNGVGGIDAIPINGFFTVTGSNKVTTLTAHTATTSDGNQALFSSITTDTELAFVHGVTSAIQTQLNTKGTGNGTVTSVSGPSIITWATATTTPTGTLNTQASNTFLAGPTSGSASAPTFRALNTNDFTARVVPDSALSTNVPLLNAAQTFTALNQFTNATSTNGVVFESTTNAIAVFKNGLLVYQVNTNGGIYFGGGTHIITGPSGANLNIDQFGITYTEEGIVVFTAGHSSMQFANGLQLTQGSSSATSSQDTGIVRLQAKTWVMTDSSSTNQNGSLSLSNINCSGTITIGNSTNVAIFTTTFTNFIDSNLYTNTTGRNLFIWSPCTFTPGTGIGGNATYAITVGGVIKSVFSSGTLATSLAMPETNAISYLVTNGGVYAFTNLSSGTGSSATILPGGYTETH